MPFIIQGKTKWKFLLIVIVLAAIIGSGIWYFYQKSSVSKFAGDYYNELYKKCSDSCADNQ